MRINDVIIRITKEHDLEELIGLISSDEEDELVRNLAKVSENRYTWYCGFILLVH